MLGGTKHTSLGMAGKHHSEDAKRRIALSNSISHKGKYHSEETKSKMCKSQLLNYKKEKVKYRGLHIRIEKLLGKPTKCSFCDKENLSGKKIHWANKSRKYLFEINDWIRLCVPCHKAYDKKLSMSC